MSLDWLNVVSLSIGAVGIIATTYFGYENYRINRKLRSLDWKDVVLGARDLASEIRKEFKPDLIYAPDPRGGIVAFLIRDSLGSFVPVLAGATFWKSEFGSVPAWEGFIVAETNKVHLMVPKASVGGEESAKLLIVDDLAMSGDGLNEIISLFVREFGFDRANIKTCTLIASETAIKTGKAPDYFWRQAASYDFFFPWGRAR